MKRLALAIAACVLLIPANPAHANEREIGDCSASDKRALEYERTTPDGEHNHLCINYPTVPPLA